MKQLPLFILLFLLACSPAKKAARQAQKAETARQAENDLLRRTRAAFPCDTVSIDTVYTTVSEVKEGKTIYTDTGSYRVDTFVQVKQQRVSTVIVDSAHTRELRNTNQSLLYQGQLLREKYDAAVTINLAQADKIEQLKTNNARLIWILIALGVVLAAFFGIRTFLKTYL